MVVKLPLERKVKTKLWFKKKQNKRSLIRSGPTPNDIANRFTKGKTKLHNKQKDVIESKAKRKRTVISKHYLRKRN